MPLHPPTVTVVEPRPRWTPELQRQFVGENVRVRHCTRLADLREPAAAGSAVVVDFDAAPADALQFLGRRVGRHSRTQVIAIASALTAELEWTARDLGALGYLIDVPHGQRLADLCRRQWAAVEAPRTESG